MPAIDPEIDGALEEGINIEFLSNPTEVIRNNGSAVGLKCIRMELGEPDASGRRRPVPKEGSDFEVEATAVIAAVSQEPDFGPVEELHEGKDWIKADEWGVTKDPGIYAGGDNLNLALVATAVYQGRMAAQAIEAHIKGEDPTKPEELPATKQILYDWYPESERHEREQIPVEQRDMEAEIESGLTEEAALEEAKRCMSCGMCMDCETCWMYCTNNCFIRLPKGEHYKIKMDVCNGCKKCAEACPCGYIDLI
jgi:NADPH-dependent glutamate synthase beta subunit-like oxidoreductase